MRLSMAVGASLAVLSSGACVTVRAPGPTVAMQATIEEAQPQAGQAQARVAFITGSNEQQQGQCQMPCTLAVNAGPMQRIDAFRPDGARHGFVVNFDSSVPRYRLHYRNQAMGTTGLVFMGLGAIAGATTSVFVASNAGVAPVVVTGSAAIVLLLIGGGLALGAGADRAEPVATATPTAQRRAAPAWAMAPVVSPTITGGTLALRF
ncbi:MAG: hypothetical protein U0269_33780 [Polyangiales bacterium]